MPAANSFELAVRHTSADVCSAHGSTKDFNLDIGREGYYYDREKTGRAQDHGHDAQTAGRKIQRMIAAMTADVGMVRIQDTRIFPSMDHWTCLQPSEASATAVTAPIWQ